MGSCRCAIRVSGRRVWGCGVARPEYRDLPPVEPIDVPDRMSMTLLKHGDACPRSAYLYRKYGSAPASQLDRGTGFHIFGEQVPWTLLQAEEEVLQPDVAEAMMNAVLDEHPELHVTSQDADDLRMMAYHMAGDPRGRAGERKPDDRPYPVGFDWNVNEIVAVERMFVLEVEGVRVVGKVDLAWFLANNTLKIRDHKTSMAMLDAAGFEGTFQTRLYGAMALFGNPLNEETGELEPCFGSGVNWADVGEVYPRFLERDTGRVQERAALLSRTDLRKFVDVDVARVVRKMKVAFESWKFGAARGSHCEICPAIRECPLPEALRPFAGKVNSLEQAAEALEWAEAKAAQVSATRAEVKVFARAHQVAVPCGTDQEYQFVVTDQWTTRWAELEAGVERARLFGEPFAMSEVRKRSVSTQFKRVRVAPAEVAS